MSHSVTLSPSGEIIDVADGITVLDACLSANVNIPYSCRNGSCGVCKSLLVNGKVSTTNGASALSPEEISKGYILTCSTFLETNVEIKSEYLPELDEIQRLIIPCKVASLSFPSEDISILSLRLPPSAIFKYLAGQFIDLLINGEKRSYSIANVSSSNNSLELHIRRVEGGLFSEYIFNDLKVGDLLRLDGPHGTFFVRESSAPILFLAGGTGYAPVKAMMEQLLLQKTSRVIYVYWGVSNSSFFYSEAHFEWKRHFPDFTYVPVVFENDSNWNGRNGFVHEAVIADIHDLTGFDVYACGSPNMIEAARKSFVAIGLMMDNFYADAFVSSN